MQAELLLQNPWWEDVHKIEDDPQLLKIRDLPFCYKPEIISSKELLQSCVLTLRGPRQVGKTTFIKLLIRQLIDQGVPPRNIFYFNTELMANDKELFETFKNFYDFSSSGHRLVFFDEITSVVRWEYAVKHIIDTGLGKDVFFLLTGSSATDLRRGGERLPGRRGLSNPDRLLLPLSFRQFCNLQGFDKFGILDFSQWRSFLSKNIKEIKVFFNTLQNYFQNYLIHGGFLLAINDYKKNSALSSETFETYKAAVISDFGKLRKDRIILRNIIRRILLSLATPVSWNGLAIDAGGISVNTAKEYVQLLADSYMIYILEFLDRARQTPNMRKNKKLYVVDPLIYQVFALMGNSGTEPDISKIIEGLIGAELARSTENNLHEGFSSLTKIYYWRSTRNKEVDFILLFNNKEIPVEIKYKSRIMPLDYSTIKRSFEQGIVLTKDTFFDTGDIIGLPVCCFLYLLG